MGTGHPQWPMTNLFPLLRAANAFHCVYITAVNCCWLVPLIWGHGLTRVQLLPPLCQRRYLLPFACWLLPAFEPCCIWPLPRGERWRNRVCLPVCITFCLPTSASSARTPHWLQQKPQACPYLVPVTFCSTNIKNIRQQSPCTQDPPPPPILPWPFGSLGFMLSLPRVSTQSYKGDSPPHPDPGLANSYPRAGPSGGGGCQDMQLHFRSNAGAAPPPRTLDFLDFEEWWGADT